MVGHMPRTDVSGLLQRCGLFAEARNFVHCRSKFAGESNLTEHDSLRWEVCSTSMNRLAGTCVVLKKKMLEVILVNCEHDSALPRGINRITSSFPSTSSELSTKDLTVGGPADRSIFCDGSEGLVATTFDVLQLVQIFILPQF